MSQLRRKLRSQKSFTLIELMTVTVANGQGQTAGPFMGSVPTPPAGGSPTWGTAYTFTANANGTFTLAATGDNTTVTVP